MLTTNRRKPFCVIFLCYRLLFLARQRRAIIFCFADAYKFQVESNHSDKIMTVGSSTESVLPRTALRPCMLDPPPAANSSVISVSRTLTAEFYRKQFGSLIGSRLGRTPLPPSLVRWNRIVTVNNITLLCRSKRLRIRKICFHSV